MRRGNGRALALELLGPEQVGMVATPGSLLSGAVSTLGTFA